MKKWNRCTLVGAALVVSAALLVGCTVPESESNVPPAETHTPAPTQETATAEPQQSPEPTPAATTDPAQEAAKQITAQLDRMSGWGTGTAGSTLSSADAAYRLIVCCDENNAEELDVEVMKAAVAEWLADVPEEFHPDMKENWQTVIYMGTSILAQDEYAMTLLSDLECTPIESETAEKNWTCFCQAANAVLAQ